MASALPRDPDAPVKAKTRSTILAGAALTAALLCPTSALAQSGGADPDGGGATSGSAGTTGSSGPSGTSGTTGTSGPSTANSAPVTLTKTRIKSLQRRLHVHADGSLGPRTRTAIKSYERKHHLHVDGKPDAALMGDLGLAPVAGGPSTTTTTGNAPTGPAGPTGAPAPAAAATVVAAARSKIGAPYASGAAGPGSFDCSGLTMWAFQQAGITLERSSFDQYAQGTAVDKSAIQPGDLVFFSTDGSGASHVGIATSPTTAVSATSHGVAEHAIDDDYWGANYVGARRVTQ